MKEVEQLTKEARKELAHYVSAYFDVLYYQELIEDKGDKTMNAGSQVEAREGQINQELSAAESAAHRLMSRIDELENQLSEVLHPVVPSPLILGKEAEQVEVTLVHLASRIRDHYKLIQDQGTRVGEMMNRLEIR